jgi:hypothetical protein
MTSEGKVLLSADGAFVDEAEVRTPDGSRLKLKLRGGRVIVRVLEKGSLNQTNGRLLLVKPGRVPAPTAEPTIILLDSPIQAGKSSGSVQFQVTWSLTLLVSVRLRNILGDFTEEYVEKRKRLGKSASIFWFANQSARSILPIVWQVMRHDLSDGLSAWRLWRSV